LRTDQGFFVVKTSYLQNFDVQTFLKICGCLVGIDLWMFVIPGRQYHHLTIWYDTVPVCKTSEIWITYINNVLSSKTILFDILDF